MAEVASASPRLVMRGIRKTFGATVALAGIDLAVDAGDVCALVGQNGAGKSTLMSVLSGAVAPDEGTMTLDGTAYAPAGPLDARRAGVAMIYQALSLAPHLTVEENLVLGVEPTKRGGMVDRAAMRSIARRALEAVGHEALAVDRLVGDLSPAEQQLVEIARAVALECRVIVLDEPTSSLTHDDVQRLFALVARLSRSGVAIVYISHFLEEVMTVADRFVVMRDGQAVGRGAIGETNADALARMMVGTDVGELYPRRRRKAGDTVLTVRDVDAGGGTLELRRGEILGIAGLLGAGRSHFIRAVFGLEPVRRGTVSLGAWSGRTSPRESWRRGMGFVSEDRIGEGLATSLGVADNVTLSKLDGLGVHGFVSSTRQRAAADRWVNELGIRCSSADQPVAALSGGNQQKVVIGRLLHHDVDVLLLDEPTRGIDVGSKAQIYALLDAMVSSTDRPPKAVVMVSSYFPELLGVCDRVAVMARGRLGEFRPVSEWTEHALVMAASGAKAS